MLLDNFTPNNYDLIAFLEKEKDAEIKIITSLSVKHSYQYKKANSKSLASQWSKFRDKLDKSKFEKMYFQHIDFFVDNFINYMMNRKAANIEKNYNDPEFISEVFNFVSIKIVEENFSKNRIISDSMRHCAYYIVSAKKIQSYIHEAFNGCVKRIREKIEENKDNIEDSSYKVLFDNIYELENIKNKFSKDFNDLFISSHNSQNQIIFIEQKNGETNE